MCEIPWQAPGSFLELVDIYQMENYLRLTVKSVKHSHSCPNCNHISFRPHSRYTRLIQDLPLTNQPVKLLSTPKKSCTSDFKKAIKSMDLENEKYVEYRKFICT